MDNKLESLFELIETSDTKAYSSILFNIYEDRDYYTIEACFDDDFVIGRDNPFVICDKAVSWEKVEQDIGQVIEAQVEEKKDTYKQFTTIAYGFVDGDLQYIRKSPKKIKEIVHYTADDFTDFDSHKLGAWIMVYLTTEATAKYRFDMIDMIRKKELSEDEHKFWREILAENFDYEKYKRMSE